jgi:hypothetical protein
MSNVRIVAEVVGVDGLVLVGSNLLAEPDKEVAFDADIAQHQLADGGCAAAEQGNAVHHLRLLRGEQMK